MYQYEKRLDCHALGQEIKRRRKAKGWTQEHLAQLVDLTPRSIMYESRFPGNRRPSSEPLPERTEVVY